MTIQLSDHFTFRRLLRFTLPAVAMMVFTSIYGIVDGFFVSNFVGKTPFAAVNFIFPYIMILGTIGFMFGAGGNALISKTMGEGDHERANSLFSLLIYTSIVVSLLLTLIGGACIRPVARWLGAEGELLEDSVLYGRVCLVGLPMYILQFEFQSLFSTAERPKLGLVVTIAAGVANMALDALFVGLFRWGLVGAAAATGVSQAVGGGIPLLYFALPNRSLLRLGRTKMDIHALLKVCTNGASELLSNISMSLVSMLYNYQLLRYAGENGVAAYGVLMYVGFVFFAVFIGYGIGVAPVVGYHYGAQNPAEIKNLLTKSMLIIGITSLVMTGLAELLGPYFAQLFVGYDAELMAMTKHGFFIYSFAFLIGGVGVFSSAFFTALNNGLVSGILSFMRTFVYQVIAVMVMPLWLNVDGIWAALVVAEAFACATSIAVIVAKRK